MTKTACELQKERIRRIEGQAAALLEGIGMAVLTLVNEEGYSRACAVTKIRADGFAELIFITHWSSQLSV